MAEIESGLPNQDEFNQAEQMPGQEPLGPEAQEGDAAGEATGVEGGEQSEALKRELAFKKAEQEIDADSKLGDEEKAFYKEALAKMKEGRN